MLIDLSLLDLFICTRSSSSAVYCFLIVFFLLYVSFWSRTVPPPHSPMLDSSIKWANGKIIIHGWYIEVLCMSNNAYSSYRNNHRTTPLHCY